METRHTVFQVINWYNHLGMRQHIGRPVYRTAVMWTAASLCALYAPTVGIWLYALAAGLLFNPWSLGEVRRLYSMLRHYRRA